MISPQSLYDRKNEEAVLERILKPVSQVMDAILIADTGSSDRTKEIAEQYTSQVFDFPWCDDFSAPRNFLLEKSAPIIGCGWMRMMSWMKKIWKD